MAALLGIGGLAKATGIPQGTLRNWERRYGFPRPVRQGRGHRRYPLEVLEHLRLIRRALDLGMRAGEVVGLGQEELREAIGLPEVLDGDAGPVLGDWLEAVERLDAPTLRRSFRRAWASHGARGFVLGLAVPFMHEVGERWAGDRLMVMQEHFASELLRGFLSEELSTLRPREPRARVVVAGLEGELHGLGALMASVLLSVGGYDVVFLGANTPAAEVVGAAARAGAAAVVIGSSPSASVEGVEQQLGVVRAGLCTEARLFVGGGPPVLVEGATWVSSLDELVEAFV